MTKTYTQLCAELAPLQAKADCLERDLVAFDAWIVSEEGQRFLDLREARNDAFYALPIAEQARIHVMTYPHNPDILETARALLARIEAQRAHGEALADALEQAEAERDEAAQAAWSAWGTRHEASAQAALHRAVAHYEAALDELGQWIALVDAIDALGQWIALVDAIDALEH